MADGGFRGHQPGAGPFYPPQHSQYGRSYNRATSPHGGRRPFNNDTPSPSRSPVNSSVAHNFNMYNHNNQHNQYGMINGGQNHQRFNQMHMSKHQNHYAHHNQVNQHHNAPHAHMGHQHNISSGNFQNATPHMPFGHEHGANGNGDGRQHEDNDEPDNEYWQEQVRLYNESREMTGPNQRAKTVAHQVKGASYGVPLDSAADELSVVTHAGVNGGQRPVLWTELDLSGQGLRALSPVMFGAYSFLRRLDLNANALTSIPPAIGSMKNLEYLDLSWNHLVELPEEIGMLTNLRNLVLFGNEIQTLPYELGFLYKMEFLGVKGNPLEAGQEQRIHESGSRGLITYLRESMPEPNPPRERPWHDLEGTSDSTDDSFKAFSYNILCERYATPQMYGYVPEKILSWGYRRSLILDEIREINADLVCLQELDRNSFDEYFRSALSMHGYQAYFAQKSRAETLGDNAKFVDGCGTFWKDKKYIRLDAQHLVLGRRAVERPGAKASADMLNRVWQRDDIATVVLLENRVTGSRIIVVNTHIFWDPVFKDVKLIQAAVLMEELSKLADKYANWAPATNKQAFRFSDAGDSPAEPQPECGPSLKYSSGTQIPMIICSDLNSDSDSAVYDLLAKKGLDAEHEDLGGRDYGSLSRAGMSHAFSLKSSYQAIEDAMPFTNYTPSFVGTLDYIWYSSNSLRVKGLLGEVDPDYLKRVPGFPNFHFPSDHLALVAEFKVEKQRTQKVVEADFGPSSKK